MPNPGKKTDFDLTASQKATDVARRNREEAAKPAEQGEVGYIRLATTGRKVGLSAFYVDHDYIPSSGKSFYGDAVRHVKDPLPGAMYVWTGISGMHKKGTMSRIRSGQYKIVTIDRIVEESDLPYDIHKILVKAGEELQAVVIHDLMLCEVHPKAVRELYQNREAEAALKVAEDVVFNKAMNDYERGEVGNMIDSLPDSSMVQMSLKAKARNSNF